MAEVCFENISKLYGDKPAVQDLDLSVEGGELVCLLGPSGCGKTTTLRMLAGFVTPDDGDISLDGRSLLKLGPEARPTAMVFQRYTLWPHMNVFHNVAFGLKLRRQAPEATGRRWGRPSNWSACRAWRGAIRPSCRAASSSAWPSPARW